jgi:hypothetical protein
MPKMSIKYFNNLPLEFAANIQAMKDFHSSQILDLFLKGTSQCCFSPELTIFAHRKGLNVKFEPKKLPGWFNLLNT